MANWIKYFDSLPESDKRTIAIAAIEHLVEIGEVKFREDDSVDTEGNEIPDSQVVDEFLYWDSCGEDLRCPF